MHHGATLGPVTGKSTLTQVLARRVHELLVENDELRSEIARLRMSPWARFKLWIKMRLGR